MEYIYAGLILNEADAEINEDNLTDVLEAAGVEVEESRVKALVAALEDVDIDEAIEEAAAVPAAGGGGAAPAAPADEGGEEAPAEEEAEAPEEGGDDEEEDEEASGEGLGALFG